MKNEQIKTELFAKIITKFAAKTKDATIFGNAGYANITVGNLFETRVSE
jgi:hypothetical protein